MEGSPLNRIARSVLFALAAALLCAVVPPVVRAQGLPDSTVQSTNPDPSEIEQYLNRDVLKDLGKPESTAKARKRLAEPLQRSNARPSSVFRLKYSQALIPTVEPLTHDANDEVAVNSLRLAGLLGTKEGLDAAEAALADKREAIRVAAANAISVALAAQKENPAILPRNATDALDKVSAAMDTEKSPRVLEALSLALDSAIRIPSANLAGVQARALAIVLEQGSRLAKQNDDPAFDAFFGHIAKTLSDTLAQGNKSRQNEAAGVAGDIIARALRRLKAITEEQRTELALVVEQSELVIKYAGAPKGFALGTAIRNSKDSEFKSGAADLFHVLTSPPFDLPPDRYPKAP
ncbi:MAG TPA: hypothetical protein VHC70_04135 [Phycisphaerales bacterium]|nr:hypothetical protein [Phycisphaerales bacterium]